MNNHPVGPYLSFTNSIADRTVDNVVQTQTQTYLVQ